MEISNQLNDINEKMSTFEDEISFEKEDILKIETFLSECLECLENQKIALRNFMETKKKLEEEKAEYLRQLNQEVINENIEANNTFSEGYVSVNNEKVLNSTINETIETESNFPCSEIIIPDMKINCLSSIRSISGFFIGGSNGTLLRYDPINNTKKFETGVDDDIIGVEFFKKEKESFLIAFTDKNYLIFNVDSISPKKVFEISGYKYSFKYRDIIGAVLLDGNVKRFCLKTCTFVDETSIGDFKCHCFYRIGKFNLATFFNDSALYRFLPNVPRRTRLPIPSVNNVKGILYVGELEYLCHSDNFCWLLNENHDILDRKVFEDGIKHISVAGKRSIVCDRKNTVLVFNLDCGYFSQIYNEKRFELEVTALGIFQGLAYVACGGKLFYISRVPIATGKRKSELLHNPEIVKKAKKITPACPDLDYDVECLDICAINGRIVHKICLYSCDIFIGGSEGMLLRHSDTYTHTYDTGTKADILQIEMLKFQARVSLIAFTKTSILIFKDIDEYVCHEKIIVPEVGIVINASGTIFIPLANGSVKKIMNHDLCLKDHVLFNLGSLRCYAVSRWHSEFALVTLSDLRLYKIDKSNSGSVTLVPGPEGVIGLRRLGKKNFLCHSDTKIWTLDAMFHIVNTFHCKGIRFLDVTDDCIGFIDTKNTLFVYDFIDKDQIGDRLLMTSIDGEPTALSIRNTYVCVSVGNTIHSYVICFR